MSTNRTGGQPGRVAGEGTRIAATCLVTMALGASWMGCATCGPVSPLLAPIPGPDRYAPDLAEMAEYQPDYQLLEVFEAGLDKGPYGATWARDASLDCAANVAGRDYVATKKWPLPPLQQQWIAWRCGSPFRARMALRKYSGGASGAAADALMNALHDEGVAVAREPDGAFGLAGESSGPRQWFTLATRSRVFEVKPVSKVSVLGGKLEIEGCFLVPRANPVLHVTGAGPDVSDEKLVLDDKRCFRASTTLPREVGVYYVEVTSEEPTSGEPGGAGRAPGWDDWYTSNLWFPVHVGVAEPASLPVELTSPTPNPSVAEWGQALVNAYNRERTRYGLPPLSAITTWGKLASAEAATMAGGGAPTADSGLPNDLQAVSAGRSWATIQSLEDHATMSLMRPSKRAWILSKATTGICLGVAPIPKQQDPGEEGDSDDDELPSYSVVEFALRGASN